MKSLNVCLIFSLVIVLCLFIPLASATPGGDPLPGGHSRNPENETGNDTLAHQGKMAKIRAGIDNATESRPTFRTNNTTDAGNEGPGMNRRNSVPALDNWTRPDNQTHPDFGNSPPTFNESNPVHMNRTPPGNHSRMDIDNLSQVSPGIPPDDENWTSQRSHPHMGPWNATGTSGTGNSGQGNMTAVGFGYRDGDWDTRTRNETGTGNYSLDALITAFLTLLKGVS